MRICSFNVENFFARPRAMNQETWAEGRPVLAAHAELNTLIEEAAYTPAAKARMVELLDVLGLTRSPTRAAMAVLRQIRGRLVRRPQGGGVEVVADGRGDWVGWVDLTTEPVTAAAIANTARVIRDLNPHVLGVVEAENRVVLKHFTDAQLRIADPGTGRDVPLFPHVMLIDGNDDRGIDVALLTQRGYPLGPMRSHLDDADERGRGVLAGLPRVRAAHARRAPAGDPGQPLQVQGVRLAGREQRAAATPGPAGGDDLPPAAGERRRVHRRTR